MTLISQHECNHGLPLFSTDLHYAGFSLDTVFTKSWLSKSINRDALNVMGSDFSNKPGF